MSMELLGEFESDEDEAEQVDNLISKELMELSFDSRTALEEEIHGVHCMALEETPELLRVSLRRLEAILECDKTIPQKEKEAYIRSNSMPMTYIHTNDFKLRFLRLTLFDVTQAAKQIVRFLDVACFLFGEILLERPIRLSDFSKKEQQYIRNGYLQFLPFRDRSGRRVFAVINPPTCGTPFNEMFEGLSISERVSNINQMKKSDPIRYYDLQTVKTLVLVEYVSRPTESVLGDLNTLNMLLCFLVL